jgi:comEA protein
MRGVFTRDERAVVCFLAASLAVGSLVLLARRVEPALEPESAGAAQDVLTQAGAKPAPVGPIDVNAATADELTALPGIGPVRAAAIVRLREERGAFGSVDELLDVKGIGPVTLERLRPLAAAIPRPRATGTEGATRPDSVARGSETPE